MPNRNTTAAPASDDSAIVAIFERLALDAGRLVMDVYASDMVVAAKPDLSPVTAADHASEKLILKGLRSAFPDIPCVAEEEIAAGIVPCALDGNFLLIDPLDGTREFVSRRPDFTVNIALVRNGVPEVGVVFAPARGEMHTGYPGHAEAIAVGEGFAIEGRRRVHVRTGFTPLTIVASRSHRTHDTDLYIRNFEAAEIVSVGSSLKFCMIASGEADLYPRFGVTMEWDTAAGDAVLRAAGGMTMTLDGRPLTYGKRGRAELADFVNPSFVAKGRIEERG
jgi:3'(2'), 5'-bisphosphate nucleotidase